MKTKFTILISILMLIFLLPKDIQAQTATQPLGDGTAEQPYRVSTLNNLYWITQNSTSWDKHFIQTANIDATSTTTWDTGSGFSPIGNSTTQFTGTYDGQGYTIDALYINRSSTSSLAFIGYIDDASAEVENLGITNCDITGRYRTGAIVGYLIGGSVNKCYSTGTVKGYSLVGGLVGFNSTATITNSYSKANVTRTSGTNSFISAFVGTVTSGTVENCYATGDVSYDGATNPTNKGFSGGSSGGTFNNNFFDSEVSNQTSATGATTKTTTEMQNISTYTDKATTGLTNAWDFIETPYNDYSETDIWGMNMNSYPHLLTGNKEPEGDGSIYSPYKITNLQNLLWLTQNTDVWINKYFEQTANIDAYATISWDNGAGFSPIGNSTTSFSGFYKGKNHAINNLYINRPSNNNVAFIGIISGASTRITNLGITNCNITGNQITAGLIGTYVNNLSASAILRNCYTSGTITGNSDYTAGLIARIYDDEIEVYNCYSNCDVTGTSYVAGLVGYYYGDSNQDNIISSSYSTGTITGSSTYVGGLIGYAYYIETSNCYSKANIVNTASSSSRNGAFVGQSSYSTIEYSYATGSVSNAGTNPTVNGFVGNYSSSTFTNNFFDSEASNQSTGTGATGLTTAQMKNQFSLTNWDFVNETTNGTNDYWQIDATVNDGYPSLAIPSGSGTSSAPYVIATLSDLKWLSGNSSSWDKDFIQVADIDASTIATFSPIGSSTTNFTGTYDGQNYKINGLNVGYGTNQGLFGYVGENAELKNIIVENATVGSANNENTGILIGRINEGTVTNCHTSGTVLGRIYTGGLIGYAMNSDITKSSSSANVTTSYRYGGGLIGYSSAGSISKSFATGNVGESSYYLGGFIGNNTSTITECYSTGNVTGNGSNNGGFVGIGNNITNSYSKGNVTRSSGSTNTSIAAFAGSSSGISNCYSTGSVIYDGEANPTDKGFIGSGSGTFANNFFDSDVSNQTTATGATAQTTTNMKLEATFTSASWDFMGETTNGTDNYWYISSANDGYPSFIKVNGEGTSTNPYEIANLDDLYWISQNNSVWSSSTYFIQTADIDASETATWDEDNDGTMDGFIPIGDGQYNKFAANYDGQGYVIDGLFINRPSTSYIGLFGYVDLNFVTIENISVTNCNITGGNYSGGIIGTAYNSNMSNNVILSNASVTGQVNGSHNVGGIIGYAAGKCNKLHNAATVTALTNYVGGLIGYNIADVEESYNTGAVSGTGVLGGLIGNSSNADIESCYSTGTVTRVSGSTETNIGSLIGVNNNTTIEHCYATGAVSVADGTALTANGFIGTENGAPTYIDNFFNSTTTGQTSATGATAKTTAEMQEPCMYIDASWDFMLESTNGTDDIWGMNASENNGFPFLEYQGYEHNNGCSPITQVTELTITEGTTNATISWTNGNGDSRVVFISESTTGEPTVADNTTYIANTTYGSGTEAGTGWYCVYNGTGTNVTLNNLTAGYEYRVVVYEYFNTAGNERYATQTGAGNLKNFTQNKYNQTITFSALAAMTYGDADFTLSATASSGLTVEYSSSDTDVATIVSGQIHIVGVGTCSIYADQPGNISYNAATQVSQTLTVNTKSLTVENASADNKVYDANTDATISNGTLNGIETGDNVTLSTGTGSFDNKNIGTNKTVTASYSISGTDASNYSLTQPTGLTANITAKGLTITGVTADDKVYDAGTDATLNNSSAVLSGVETGDVVSLVTSSTTASFDNKNIGTDKSVTASGYTISNTDAGNYTLSQPTGLTADITAKTLTVTGASVTSKTYDGNDNATIINGSLNGVIASETVNLINGTATFTSINVGISISVTANYSINGTDAGNYTLTQPSSLSGNITKASLTATADNKSKTYGEANPAFTLTYSGFVNSENSSVINTEPTATTTATTGSNVGNYDIDVSGGSDNNYSFNYVSGTLTINKANQTISITAIDDKDVNVDPLTFNVTASTTSGLTLSYAIQSGPATISGNTITLTGETGIVVVAVSQAGNTNYNAATTQTENFNVFDTSKDDQTITFGTIADKSYGDEFDLTATASSGLTVSYTIISGPASLSGNTVTITGIGSVTVEASQAGDNDYNPAASVQQSFNAVKANQTITITAIENKDISASAFDVVASTTSSLGLTYAIQSGPATISGTTITLNGTAGTVIVEVSQGGNTNYNAASNTTNFEVTNSTAIANISKVEISVYPNPTVDILKVDFADNKIKQYRIIDFSGKVIYQKSNVSNKMESIDFSTYKKGTYLLHIQSENTIIVRKIIKL